MTEIGEKIGTTLDYAMAERGLVVLEGPCSNPERRLPWRRGAAHASYLAVPATSRFPSSNTSTWISIVPSATASALALRDRARALELRAKIEDTVAGSDLILVLDEGHYLFPVRNQRRAAPHRINWILTQLVNKGVPVAIIATPQFTSSLQAVEKNGWSSAQLIGRNLHYERLADELGDDDLGAVAGYWLPSADERIIDTLIDYAKASKKYLQGIESLVRRSRFLAGQNGRSEATYNDVLAALNESVIPSDNALATALSGARHPARKKAAIPPPTSTVHRPSTPRERRVLVPPIARESGALARRDAATFRRGSAPHVAA